ncbi:MAG: shikimate dehydrogenase [Actinobacteria bacterium]|nr:shikimate dehydrogenase [Actinomycetota bacterium]
MIRAAVLGSPISHSLSPTLHRRAYEVLGIAGTFEAVEVGTADLGAFIASSDSSWTGFSLTMPLKEEVMKFAAKVSDVAMQVASANTLIRVDEGWSATSTDVNGFVQSLHQHGYDSFANVLIIGAGATARAAAAACEKFTDSITVIHRSSSREKLMKAAAPNSEMMFCDWTADVPPAELIINTTPAGVADVFVDRLNSPRVFFEALYNPWPTRLLASARSGGSYGIDGLDLLIHQGIDQVALMSGKSGDRSALASELRSACLAKLVK